MTGLSHALRETTQVIELLREMKELGYDVMGGAAKMHCKVFEDSTGAIQIARHHKYRPSTKHRNNRQWPFRSYVDEETVTIHTNEANE